MSYKENGTFCAWPPQSRQHNQPNWQTNKGIVGRHIYLPYLPGCDVLFCMCFQRRDWIAQQFCRQRGWSELNRCVESKKCNMSPAAILWPRLKTVYTTNRARSTFYHQAKHVCVSECVYPWGGKLQRETRGQSQSFVPKSKAPWYKNGTKAVSSREKSEYNYLGITLLFPKLN